MRAGEVGQMRLSLISQNNKLVLWQLLIVTNYYVHYHYELMDLYTLDVFKSIELIIFFFWCQIVSS